MKTSDLKEVEFYETIFSITENKMKDWNVNLVRSKSGIDFECCF